MLPSQRVVRGSLGELSASPVEAVIGLPGLTSPFTWYVWNQSSVDLTFIQHLQLNMAKRLFAGAAILYF